MANEIEIAWVGQLLDAYAVDAWLKGVSSDDEFDAGVPPEMQAGPVDDEGWVEWRVLPSTLNEREVTALEKAYDVTFPSLFRAYLLARFHLFNQVKSRRYDQGIMLPDTPSRHTLNSLEMLISGWQPLISAGYIPFAEWGDGWGPMCFDSTQRAADGDCPIVWMDHEEEALQDPKLGCDRLVVQQLAQPLYSSCKEFLVDVFGKE